MSLAWQPPEMKGNLVRRHCKCTSTIAFRPVTSRTKVPSAPSETPVPTQEPQNLSVPVVLPVSDGCPAMPARLLWNDGKAATPQCKVEVEMMQR